MTYYNFIYMNNFFLNRYLYNPVVTMPLIYIPFFNFHAMPKNDFGGFKVYDFSNNKPAPEDKRETYTVKREEKPEEKFSGKKEKLTDEKKENEFLRKTKRIARQINCDYRDLLALMNSESGIRHTAVNKSSNATGLIQFTPQTARDLGTSVEELKNMTALEQLDYVKKYLEKYKKAAGFKSNEKLDAGDLYALVFLPARAKRDVLTDSSEKYYKPNAPALDLNKDGKITKTELAQRMNTHKVSDFVFFA